MMLEIKGLMVILGPGKPNNVGMSNTPDLSAMEEGHKQPDTPEVSSRET